MRRHDGYAEALTLAEYRRLEEAGHLARPLTDGPLGADPTRRQADANASACFTAGTSVVDAVINERGAA